VLSAIALLGALALLAIAVFALLSWISRAGEDPFRGELSETFCREQRRLLSARAGAVPTWHERTPDPRKRTRGDLKQFWSSMEERAQQMNA